MHWFRSDNRNSEIKIKPLGAQLRYGFEEDLRKLQVGDDHRNLFHSHIGDLVSNDEIRSVNVEDHRGEEDGGSDEDEGTNWERQAFEGTVGIAFDGEKDGRPALEDATEPYPRACQDSIMTFIRCRVFMAEVGIRGNIHRHEQGTKEEGGDHEAAFQLHFPTSKGRTDLYCKAVSESLQFLPVMSSYDVCFSI